MLARVVALLAAALFAHAALAAQPPIFSDRDGAIRGYDPVAYFDQSAPVKGSKEFRHNWRGATWYFASGANRDKFAAEPERFAPQYGGYCAYGVALGSAPPIDPNAWSIVGGKLYLNFNLPTRAIWEKDVPSYVRKADANWPAVLQKP
jgi:YHS domain-containing protein